MHLIQFLEHNSNNYWAWTATTTSTTICWFFNKCPILCLHGHCKPPHSPINWTLLLFSFAVRKLKLGICLPRVIQLVNVRAGCKPTSVWVPCSKRLRLHWKRWPLSCLAFGVISSVDRISPKICSVWQVPFVMFGIVPAHGLFDYT